MSAFRILLLAAWLVLVVYTGAVISANGMGFLPVFLGDIARMGWAGQFNLDFLMLLALSALWTAWRNAFSPTGLLLALGAFVGGSGFMLVYLIVLTIRTKGDMAKLLLGPTRA